MDGSPSGMVSLSQAISFPLMCLIFALALLVVAIALFHLVRALATVNQLGNSIAEAKYDQQRFTAKPPSRQEPSLGDEADALEAIRIAREERGPSGNGAVDHSGDVITTDENARVDDERSPIGDSGMYRGR